jgi:hypothetical protein
MDQAPLCCEFNGAVSLTQSSRTSSASSVTCVTPKQTNILSSRVTVRVVLCNAFNAYEEALSDMSQFLFFEYTEDQKVLSFLPTVGYVSGGTTISIIGYGFTSYSKYLCSFASLSNVMRVNARVVGPSLMICITPNLNLNATTKVDFLVTVNGTDDSSKLVSASLTFLELPLFFSLTPSIGIETGGTSVVIHSNKTLGGYFTPSCRFGIESSAVTQGILVTSGVSGEIPGILCITPSFVPFSVEIYVSPNGFDFVAAGFVFDFVAVPTVISLSPQLLTNMTENVVLTGISLFLIINIFHGYI